MTDPQSKSPVADRMVLGYRRPPKLPVLTGRHPRKKFPYNTRLELESKTTVQVCCRCFKRSSQGACAAHFAEHHMRLLAAESALEIADEKVAAVEAAFRAMGANNIRSEYDAEPFKEALTQLFALRGLTVVP